MFDKHSRPAIPRIFRYLFEKDEEFQTGLADSLTAEYGKYDEISFTCPIVPLPEDDAEECPSKRQRSMGPDSGLISFS
jgi:hypothetical protein